jgi:hypothetical protein
MLGDAEASGTFGTPGAVSVPEKVGVHRVGRASPGGAGGLADRCGRTARGPAWTTDAPRGSGTAGRNANRLGAGDDPVTQDGAAAGGGGLTHGVPVRGDGSGGGSASTHLVGPGPVTLSTTEEEVAGFEDTAIMARFVRDYLGLLDERVTTITGQLESGNDLTAHISLLSLESTSLMVGAKELAKIAGLLRGAVERGQRSTVPALVTALTAEAARVHDVLTPST